MLTPVPSHRGFVHLTGETPRILSGFLMMAYLSYWLWAQSLSLFTGWSVIAQGLSTAGAPLRVTLSNVGTFLVTVKAVSPTLSMGQSILLMTGLGVVFGGLSMGVSPLKVPLRYFLRTLAVVVVLPAVGYWISSGTAPLDVEAHLAQVFKTGYWFLVVSPLLFAITGYVLPGSVSRKIGVSLVSTFYLYLTIPILALLHYHVILLMGPASVAVLNVFFTTLILSFEFISFYGVLASQP